MVNKIADPGNPAPASVDGFPENVVPETQNAAPGKTLSPEARRALDEANARREAEKGAEMPAEVNGPSGEEPTRYGDWERKGLAVDF